ncbi:MAG: nucleotidyltransferase substrate binding protein [Clostridium sp.]|uniref:HI0074 family nucleotidyltransferase substrate-binding subunit n=1 Tax=Clostridium sp. TaxID=1506 RepID=UPI0025BBF76E|nr:HI0074 family nucleotidyltransferase substrate-binding subunit [Clostridium sp.]MCH3963138.1 nucleotidyltransferase substrate binding protein [Clostridium sp.]MCI1716399.1 nucleotidyltransferase substrate binding protein [Clostridium sp.]MCI1800739.1 nucleotidyltransferase substrate binding protein [Clostridium sp.]MCI1814606.1 nucleotidyltransferase substrate binding protein [Clostridium sp.]MCI1871516.1 nucleotidyltransferase substrate binding protein [Clostridium sp.]
MNNFIKALNKLDKGLLQYDGKNELLRYGLIQRFEFTFELAWKTLKEVFKDEGLMELNSPKSVLKEAFSSGLIENEKLWINMLKDRNFTLYMYSESISMEISENIKDKYVDTLNKLKDKIVERRKKYS